MRHSQKRKPIHFTNPLKDLLFENCSWNISETSVKNMKYQLYAF